MDNTPKTEQPNGAQHITLASPASKWLGLCRYELALVAFANGEHLMELPFIGAFGQIKIVDS